MKIVDVEQGTDEWLEYRKGKISGTLLGALYSKKGNRKIGFYEMLAERLSLDPDEENRMARGLRLEEEAIARFERDYNKIVERVGICVHDDHPDIINSPDGIILNDKEKKYLEAVEVKCLSPARHLQCVVENVVPPEFEAQMLQYFIVNPDLEILYFVFYDPRVTSKDMHVIPVTRDELDDRPASYLQFQLDQLDEINKLVKEIAF